MLWFQKHINQFLKIPMKIEFEPKRVRPSVSSDQTQYIWTSRILCRNYTKWTHFVQTQFCVWNSHKTNFVRKIELFFFVRMPSPFQNNFISFSDFSTKMPSFCSILVRIYRKYWFLCLAKTEKNNWCRTFLNVSREHGTFPKDSRWTGCWVLWRIMGIKRFTLSGKISQFRL